MRLASLAGAVLMAVPVYAETLVLKGATFSAFSCRARWSTCWGGPCPEPPPAVDYL
jgi:hypothetical protein